MVSLTLLIDGVDMDGLVNLHELKTLVTFDHDAVQANLTVQDITLVNEAAKKVRNYIAEGTQGGYGIFEGLPVKIIMQVKNGLPRTIFDGYIDFTQNYKEVSPVKVQCKLVKAKGLNDLETKLSALTYGLLKAGGPNTLLQNGLVTQDFQIVLTRVIQYDQDFQTLLLYFLAFETAYTLVSLTNKIQTDITNVVTAPLTLVLDAIYAGIVLVQYLILAKKIIEIMFPVPKKNLGISYYTALQKAAQFLGYGFNTSIAELNSREWVYLPSKPDQDKVFNKDGLTKGIPQATDYGYTCAEMFDIVKKLFDAKIAVVPSPTGSGVSHTIQIHSQFSPYWNTVANYSPPDVLHEEVVYNTDEYKGTRIIKFLTDPTDEWTIKRFTGTNFEVTTAPKTIGNRYNLLNKGLEQIDIPTALGNTNDFLEGVDVLLIQFAKSADILLQALKSPVRLSSLIANRGAALKVTSSTWNVPKTVVVKQNGYLYADQRSKVSARYLWEHFYKYSRSFLPSNPYGQKRMFNGVEIPFGFSDFVKLLDNSYFAGGKGKMVSVEWDFDKDTATATWWQGQVYTENLVETTIEP